MDACNCIEPQWPPDDLLMKYQYISDFFFALAYFSTPLELINLWTFCKAYENRGHGNDDCCGIMCNCLDAGTYYS
ncbi:hypothetical protein CXB51_002064 [Gossypium anomalum]|uniref:Uncharacterized protein n=1 Tax=Gossypium anomalum TaxID=47600 RepID=A0A8J5ZHX3_9ROSI|nr:hypothetical protein CXB51_002064 [Gossypium anomalum]